MDQTKDPRYEEAKKRAKDKLDFLQHLMVYVVVNFLLVILNFFTSPGTWWSLWSIVGWGIGLSIHFMATFVFDGLFKGLEKRLIEAELRK